MRCSRQSSLPSAAAFMRAVSPSCGGAAAASHVGSAAALRAGQQGWQTARGWRARTEGAVGAVGGAALTLSVAS
eukprot:scaffold120180_cov27-Phaeocystis_antarctica.AAC.1